MLPQEDREQVQQKVQEGQAVCPSISLPLFTFIIFCFFFSLHNESTQQPKNNQTILFLQWKNTKHVTKDTFSVKNEAKYEFTKSSKLLMTRSCSQDTKHWEFGSSDDCIEDNASVSLSFAATADNWTAVNCSAISWICFVLETHSSCITFILAKSLRAKSRWPNSSSVSLTCCFNSLSLDSAGDSVFSKDSNHSSKSKVDCFPSRDLKGYVTIGRFRLR